MRTGKTGLDYFPLDIDFFDDPKIEFVSAKYGPIGELISIKLLCRIYRNGYYISFNGDESLLFAKKSGEGITHDLVQKVVDELLKRNFFDPIIYGKYQILTSNGIQKRYLEATKRRKDVSMCKELIIADIKEYNVNINPLNDDIGTQRITKNNKGENNKEKTLFVETSDQFRLAEYLLQKILTNNPITKKPNLQVWAKQIDLMIQADNRSTENIQALIDWCQEDDFWKCNILSTKKLREKFDQLWIKMVKKPQLKKHEGITQWLETKEKEKEFYE